jgi:hypothetical protein
MPFEDVAPPAIPQLHGGGGGAHDVGEQHGSERSVKPLLLLGQIAEESVDLPEDPVGATVPMEPVEVPRIFDLRDLRPRDAGGGETTVPWVCVTASVRINEDQRGYAHRGSTARTSVALNRRNSAIRAPGATV